MQARHRITASANLRGQRSRVQRALAIGTMSAGLLLALSSCTMGGHGEADHHGDGHLDEGAEHGHGEVEGEDHIVGDNHHEGMGGRPGVASDVDRNVAVSMTDAMDYTPASLSVEQGETIRFNVTNNGKVVHEFVLGTDAKLLEHNELMKRFPGMEHEEPNSVSLESGASGEVIWQFSEAGDVTFACLEPGHYEAGMKGAVRVSAAQ